jgi:hypothetical protein
MSRTLIGVIAGVCVGVGAILTVGIALLIWKYRYHELVVKFFKAKQDWETDL